MKYDKILRLTLMPGRDEAETRAATAHTMFVPLDGNRPNIGGQAHLMELAYKHYGFRKMTLEFDDGRQVIYEVLPDEGQQLPQPPTATWDDPRMDDD